MALGNLGKTWSCGAKGYSQPASPFPPCFASKLAFGIIVESPARRDRPPLDSNRGQIVERRREDEKFISNVDVIPDIHYFPRPLRRKEKYTYTLYNHGFLSGFRRMSGVFMRLLVMWNLRF